VSQYKFKSEGSSSILVVSLIVGLSCLLIVTAYFYTNGFGNLAGKLGANSSQTNEHTSKTESENKSTKARTPVKTASLRLPEKTNNIWAMKPFTLKDTGGKERTLSDWQGKVIILNFWASWCAPCQFEIPRFVRYQSKFAEKGLQIVGVGLDDAAKLKNVERSLEMNYPTMVIDQSEGGALLDKFGNDQRIVPYTVVIDKDGTIVYIHRGSLEEEDFTEFVLPLIQP